MVKRTCLKLVLILVTFKIPNGYAAAWLQKPGAWGWYYTSEHQLDSTYIKNYKAGENKALQQIASAINKIDKEITLLKNDSKSLGLVSSRAQEILAQAKRNRLKVLSQLKEQLLEEFNQNYIYYPKAHNSVLIEHGLKEYLTFGARIYSDIGERSFARQRSDISHEGLELLTRVKILETKKRIISVQPKIILAQDNDYQGNRSVFGTEVRLLTGINRKVKKYPINHFTNFEFGYRVENSNVQETFIGELTQGLKFKGDWYIIAQNFIEKRPKLRNAYRDTLKEQLSIAKSFKAGRKRDLRQSTSPELTIQLGYFVHYSVSHERMLSEGIVFSLWLQT